MSKSNENGKQTTPNFLKSCSKSQLIYSIDRKTAIKVPNKNPPSLVKGILS